MNTLLLTWALCMTIVALCTTIWAVELHKQRQAYRDQLTIAMNENRALKRPVLPEEIDYNEVAIEASRFPRWEMHEEAVSRKELLKAAQDPWFVFNNYFADWQRELNAKYILDGPVMFAIEEDLGKEKLKVIATVKVIGEK